MPHDPRMQARRESDGAGSPISEQVNPVLTLALWLAIVSQFGLVLASLILSAFSLPPGASLAEVLAEPFLLGVVTLAFPTVGAICLLRRPTQRVGWLLGIMALGWALANAATGYARYARASPTAMPGVDWALWLTGNSWPLFLSQGVLLLLLLVFPTGALISRSWRPLAWLVVGWMAVSAFASAFAAGPLEDNLRLGITNPAGAPGQAGAVLRALNGWLFFGFIVLLGATSFGLLIRFRRSTGAERQQIKWLAVVAPIAVVLAAGMYGGVALLGAGSMSNASREVDGPLLLLVAGAMGSIGLIPVAIGVAILRYRLYDIDVVINRTLVYGLLTATLAVAYVVTIAVFQVALGSFTGQSQLVVAASTLVVAALFQPLRAGIQRAVDRRFYRRKYNAAKALETFGASMRSQVDLEALRAEVVRAASDTVQPRQASLWLREVGAR
jgi:hypothetical protein